MTRSNPPEAAEKESRVQEALVAIRKGKYNCPQAAQIFNIPCQTYMIVSAKQFLAIYHKKKSNPESCRRDSKTTHPKYQ